MEVYSGDNAGQRFDIDEAASTATTIALDAVSPYNTLTGMSIQVQAVSGRDIERMNGLGIQGVFRSVHLDGYWRGIVRVDQVGGDLMEFPEVPGGAVRTWKVTTVAETWPDWSRVIVVLQT